MRYRFTVFKASRKASRGQPWKASRGQPWKASREGFAGPALDIALNEFGVRIRGHRIRG